MKRRAFLQSGLGLAISSPLIAAMKQNKLDAATNVLTRATTSGQVAAASLYVRSGDTVFSTSFGAAESSDAVFLLASITKPMAVAAIMTLYDQGLFDLEDPVRKYIPEFTGDGREKITMRDLMTHRSGLPDQLPANAELRSRHAGLSEFVDTAMTTPLLFAPANRYRYSSMGILLASEVAQRISGRPITTLMNEAVYTPLQMNSSALGVGHLKLDSLMRCQVENAAKESGAGDPTTKEWDWNSPYWRTLGSPWGGAHGSAGDVALFLNAFLHPTGKLLQPETARMMIKNHNPQGMRRRGLGFDLGRSVGGRQVSDRAFGHGGATGTLCWADPVTDSVCVVLTTLPSEAVKPHPRELTSQCVAEAVG